MSKPRIDLLAPPFHGHLHPLLGVARILQEFAQVRVISTKDAIPAVEAAGLPSAVILEGREAAVWSIPNIGRSVRTRPWLMWQQFHQNVALLPALKKDLAQLWAAEKPDLAIVDFTLPTAGYLARSLGIRWWTMHPSPLAIETRSGTPSYFGGLPPPQSMLGRQRDRLGRMGTRGFKRMIFAMYRRVFSSYGISDAYRTDGTEATYSDEKILAVGMPELEFNRDWPGAVRFIGFTPYTPAVDHSAPELDPVRPNVLVTVGTHLTHLRAQFIRHLDHWARLCPAVCFHFTAGGLACSNATEARWKNYRYLSYEKHLHRFAAVVHHGGSGITHHALRTGLPSVVWPQDYDQFDYAARLAHAGTAIRCSNAAAVPLALNTILTNPDYRHRARQLSATLRGYETGPIIRQACREAGLIS